MPLPCEPYVEEHALSLVEHPTLDPSEQRSTRLDLAEEKPAELEADGWIEFFSIESFVAHHWSKDVWFLVPTISDSRCLGLSLGLR